MTSSVLLASTCIALLNASAASARICVENASDQTWLFVVDADAGARVSQDLRPGEGLCVSDAGIGTVSVFESADVIEGCSRRVPEGSVELLIDFPSVDLCTWDRRRDG